MSGLESRSVGTILCCLCGVQITPNPANMCINCLRSQVDITEGIPKQLVMHQCRGCHRYLRPPWVACDLESRELLAVCLKKITGLSKVKLVDAAFVWTEPHSRRIKVRLTIQKEVMTNVKLQQAFVVEFVVQNQQCTECQRSFTEHTWKASVQVRQKVSHKKTFFFLEQLILKYNAHEKCIGIEQMGNGMDFNFAERSHAAKFVEFLKSAVPCKTKTAKQLVSQDIQNNAYNYKHTFSVELAPICKEDVVILPKATAAAIGCISPLVLVFRVTSLIHCVDPVSLLTAEIDAEKYFKAPFRALVSSQRLIDFVVLDVQPADITPMVQAQMKRQKRKKRHQRRAAKQQKEASADDDSADAASVTTAGMSKASSVFTGMTSAGTTTLMGGPNGKFLLAEATVARASDFGVNDTTFTVFTHLGHILKPGDTAKGYDLTTAVFAEDDEENVESSTLPEIVLVKKFVERSRSSKKRKWRLRKLKLDKSEEGSRPSAEKGDEEEQYEEFLQQVEEDKLLRASMNLYKEKATAEGTEDAEDTEAAEAVDVRDEELLDEEAEAAREAAQKIAAEGGTESGRKVRFAE